MDPSLLAGIPTERLTLIEIPALAISSSDCRERRAAGEPVWYLVPDGVVQYIAKHDLYPLKDPAWQHPPNIASPRSSGPHDRDRTSHRAGHHRRPGSLGQAGLATCSRSTSASSS